jgi:hypothetical protein
MNFIKYILFIFFLSICNQLFSQDDNLNREKIDSLRKIYCIDCKNYLKNLKKDSLLSLRAPLINDKLRKDFRCKKTYNIPDSSFLSVFPFNADSIIIALPKDSCDDEIRTLKKMTSEEIGKFASILYNYDYRKRAEVISILAYLKNFPIDLIFYKNGKQDYLYLRFEADGGKVFTDNSFSNDETYIYLGELCEEHSSMLQQFLLDNYNYRIFHIPCEGCKEDINIELIPIPQSVQVE